MRLIDNKRGITFDKVSDVTYWEEDNIMHSNNNIRYKQDISIHRIINSNYLMNNISNEINR
jgi:hypothetical protein